jgi:hypothetical protein
MSSWKSRIGLALASLVVIAPSTAVTLHAAETVHVDGTKGDDKNPGSSQRPLRSLSAALAKLKEPLSESVSIELAPGTYGDTGSVGMPANCLHLMCRMRPGVVVRIVGRKDKAGQVPVLDWRSEPMINATDGAWWFENLQIGSFQKSQRVGVAVSGTAHVTLQDVVFRMRSFSGGAINAARGGKVSLRGSIRINEHLHEKADEETFSGIVAEDHGLVIFEETKGASLDMGNGSLSASYYGVIRLGCESARITSWGGQSNNLAINNGGRIDLHGTTTTLFAKQRGNTPIGLEHDGHILAEGAHIIIQGENDCAIVLQKASTLTCNDIELRGTFQTAISAMSGSMFVGAFRGDIPGVSANTSATVNIEEMTNGGRIAGPVSARRGAVISLPDRTVSSK